MASPAEKRMGADLAARLDPVEGLAQDLMPANIVELRKEIAKAKDPATRALLVGELERISQLGAQVGAPVGGDGDFRPPTGEQDKMDFAPPTPTSPASPATPATEPGETPAGAVTGRVINRAPLMGPGGDIPPEVQRLGIETGAATVGGLLGARLGGPVGLRAGEAAGATLGSLAAQAVDPTEDPIRDAGVAGSATFLTGAAAGVAGATFRKLVGKPHEAGRALSEIMARKGKMPLPGAALESDFVRNAQSIGSTAFGTNELLKKAQEEAVDITTEAVKGYVAGFQRFQRSAEAAFKQYDDATRFLGDNIKVDDSALAALKDVAAASARTRGGEGALDSHLAKIIAMDKDGVKPQFSLDEVQKLYGSLYDKAGAMELQAARGDAIDKADLKYIRDTAARVKKTFDEAIDAAVARKDVDPEIKRQLRLGQASWKHWQEGKELERMLATASEDLAGEAGLKANRLGRELDKLIRREKETGTHLLSPNTKDAFRQYIIAAKAVEESGKQGAFSFIGRMGQLAGLTGLGYNLGGPAAVLFLAPHGIAWAFSNPTARSLLMRGLRMEPGSAAAVRAGRQFVTLAVAEGIIEPERFPDSGQLERATQEDVRARTIPQGVPGVNGNIVPNPTPGEPLNRATGGVRG